MIIQDALTCRDMTIGPRLCGRYNKKESTETDDIVIHRVTSMFELLSQESPETDDIVIHRVTSMFELLSAKAKNRENKKNVLFSVQNWQKLSALS